MMSAPIDIAAVAAYVSSIRKQAAGSSAADSAREAATSEAIDRVVSVSARRGPSVAVGTVADVATEAATVALTVLGAGFGGVGAVVGAGAGELISFVVSKALNSGPTGGDIRSSAAFATVVGLWGALLSRAQDTYGPYTTARREAAAMIERNPRLWQSQTITTRLVREPGSSVPYRDRNRSFSNRYYPAWPVVPNYDGFRVPEIGEGFDPRTPGFVAETPGLPIYYGPGNPSVYSVSRAYVAQRVVRATSWDERRAWSPLLAGDYKMNYVTARLIIGVPLGDLTWRPPESAGVALAGNVLRHTHRPGDLPPVDPIIEDALIAAVARLDSGDGWQLAPEIRNQFTGGRQWRWWARDVARLCAAVDRGEVLLGGRPLLHSSSFAPRPRPRLPDDQKQPNIARYTRFMRPHGKRGGAGGVLLLGAGVVAAVLLLRKNKRKKRR